MDARLLSGNAEVAVLPRCVDVTTLGTSDPVWRDFETNVTGIGSILLPVVEKREQWPLHPVAATGPSEASVWPSALDATEDRGDGIAILEIIAEMGDETAFVQAAGEIDWSQRPATDFARAVRSALAAGAHLLARNLATQGARLYPAHLELEKMARVLAPPRVVRTDIPPVPSLQANQAWLRAHGDEYRGQWVALRDGILLAAATTAKQLRAYLESTDGVLITKVF